MKKFIHRWSFIVSILAVGILLNAQSNFDPDIYLKFLEENKSMTTGELLNSNPALTTYYSHRNNPADLKNIPWYDTIDNIFKLTDAENNLLSKNYFMVSERMSDYAWADALISVYSKDLPLFLSSDFILSTLHNSYDAILQAMEWQFLEPNLMELLEAMYQKFPELYEKYKSDNRFEGVLYDIDLYTSMALSLSSDSEMLPQKHDRQLYDQLMEGIENKKMLYVPLFTDGRTRKMDLSQFTPRGHYNELFYTRDGERTLEDYFKAMMWLGRIDFLLTAPPQNPWEADWTEDELRRMQLGALLLNELLQNSGKAENLVKHERIIEFMVGPDDNLTPGELNRLSGQLLSAPEDLFEKNHFDLFMDSLNASDDYGQKIMSNFFYVDPYSADPGKLPVSFKLAGQKFLIDSYVFSEVVYDRIVFEGKKIHRDLPDPLDVMAALGNEDALALLESELDSFKYAYKMASLTYLIDSYDEAFWEQSLYNTWLAAIRELNPPVSSAKLPYFMKTTAWHHEKLTTQLTSWAQLRHDNILYGKQSYTGGTGCSYPYTYVEPYPGLYERLELFAAHAGDFFNEVLADESFDAKTRILDYYARYEEIMGRLKGIAIKELDDVPINESEIIFLKTMINSYMASGPGISGWYNDLFFDTMKGLGMDFTVADVHTQPTDKSGNVVGHVLHVGNGLINMGIFIAPCPVNPDMLMTFCGPVSSFHTEVTDNFYRLNDQEWREKIMFTTEKQPRPDWVSEYLANNEGGNFPEGRRLKGIGFNGTNIEPPSDIKDVDYLLAFPNPAREELHLRFILNRGMNIKLKVYDSSGRMFLQPFDGYLEPGEHDIPVVTRNWENGLYLVEFKAGEKVIAKRVMVN